MAKTTTDVAVKEQAGALAVIDFEQDAGAGFEDVSANSFAIPFLRILQKLSPQCDEQEAAYIEGARAGDFFNTVSEQVYAAKQGPVTVIPVKARTVFNLWAPRESGGGFRGSMSEAEGLRLIPRCTKDDKNHDITPDGDILTNTREHYVIVLESDGRCTPALLALTSTQIKKSKKWMSQIDAFRLPSGARKPMFSQIFNLTTVPEKNDSGSWMGIKIDHVAQVTNVDHYQAAKRFLDMINSGQVEVVQPADDLNEPF